MMNRYFISYNKAYLQPEKIWSLLKDQYWSKDIPLEVVSRFIPHSLCVGAYLKDSGEQVGFGRAITDYTTYAYHCDLVVHPQHQNQGLGSLLVDARLKHPELQGLKTISLRVSPQGRPFYEKRGFAIAAEPSTIVEKENLAIYTEQMSLKKSKPVRF
jgi:ribosomal protein S18 acetylase RimI-like enzyme